MRKSHTQPSKEYPKIFYVILITLISLFGIYFRLKGLGNFPFSIDEYYFYSAAKLTLENGLPNFLCGGFYSRGILLQYITVPLVYLLEDQELAARIPTVIFSVLSFPAVYLIGKASHSRLAGVLALFLFAFSIWQIEFARFARMYAPFQMIFLWQVWLFLRPDFPKRGINILLNGLLASIATLFYAGGIFCVALAFFNVILHQKSFKLAQYIPASIAAGLAMAFAIVPFRFLGAEHPYPTNYLENTLSKATNNFPIDLPSFLSFQSHSIVMKALLLLYAILLVFFLYKVFKHNQLSLLTKLIITAILISLLLNQFLLTSGLIAICILTSEKWQELLQLISSKAGAIIVISTVLWIISCAIYFLASNDIQGLTNITKAIFNNFFSYPDVFDDVFRQWQKPMPIHSLISAVSVIIITIIGTLKYSKPSIKARHFLAVFITMLLLVAVINTPYSTSRYTFFLSPLISIILAIFIVWGSSLLNNKHATLAVIIVCTVTLSYVSEDYRFKHIFNIDSYASNHRQPYNKEYAEHLYPRYDYISVADFLNKNVKTDDLVIITTPVIEYYLKPELQAEYFITPENPEFVNHSACQGKQETWSNLPLIHDYQALKEKLGYKNTSNWLILHGVRGNPFSTQQLESLKSSLEPYFVYENPDSTLKIYKVGSNNKS